MHRFVGQTADHVWRKAASHFRRNKSLRYISGRTGRVKELLQCMFVVQDPRQRWVVSRIPPMNPAFAIAEVVWIVCGRNESAFLNFWNSQLQRYAGRSKTYHGAYGFRLRRHFGTDQIRRAYQALKRNPSTRQIVLQIWDPRIDLPSPSGREAAPDIPCNICSMLKVRENRLIWTQVMRSNDIFLGLPHNFVQFTCLQEILAGWLELELGPYTHLSDSLHLYERDAKNVYRFENVGIQSNGDTLQLPEKKSRRVFLEIYRRMVQMTNRSLTKRDLLGLAKPGSLPPAYQSMVLVVTAEAARRRGWLEVSHALVSDCANPVYKQLWVRWLDRVLSPKSAKK